MPEPQNKSSYLRILSNRSFSLLWIGQLISQSGDFIFYVAILWYVLQTTQSAFLVGVTLAAELLPAAVVGPIAGVYVDRFNRKDVMLVSNLSQGIITLLMALLYLTGSLNFPLLILLVFFLVSGDQFFVSAVQATIPRMAMEEDLLAANSLFTLSSSLNQLVGFGVGGLIVALFGISVPISYDSLTFFAAAALFALIARSYGEIPTESLTEVTSSFTAKFREGLQFIRTSQVLIQLVILAVIVNFFAAATRALLAPYVQYTLHQGSATFGYILAATSLGLILGSLVVGKINAREYVGKISFLGIALFGVIFILLGLVTVVAQAMILLFIIGVTSGLVNLPLQALLQVTVPSNLMGRVFTSLVALATLSQPIAATLAGGIASYTSIDGGLQLFGVVTLAATLVTAVLFKELRSARY